MSGPNGDSLRTKEASRQMTTCLYPQLMYYNITSFLWQIMKMTGQNVLTGCFLAPISPEKLLTQLPFFFPNNHSTSPIILSKAVSLYSFVAHIRLPIKKKQPNNTEIPLSLLKPHKLFLHKNCGHVQQIRSGNTVYRGLYTCTGQ